MSRAALLPYCLALIVAAEASAQRIRLDDSLSPVDTIAIALRWEPAQIRHALGALMAGDAAVALPLTTRTDAIEVRLDTREFAGRSARIYLTLPAAVAGLASPSDLELSWDATSPFNSGAVRPGQSVLVFDGPIEHGVTTAVFTFALSLERGPSTDTFDLEPYYELEILP